MEGHKCSLKVSDLVVLGICPGRCNRKLKYGVEEWVIQTMGGKAIM
jgi:hypothetical protein